MFHHTDLGRLAYTDCFVTCLAIGVAIFVCLLPIYKKPAKTFCCILAVLCFYMCLFFRAAGAPIEWHATTILATAVVFGLQFGICYLTYETLVPR